MPHAACHTPHAAPSGLFHRSICDNIRYARGDAADKGVVRGARDAQA
jgi:hypothetical protein